MDFADVGDIWKPGLTNQSQRFRKVSQELLLADLAKTQYTRDDKGPYSCMNLNQVR